VTCLLERPQLREDRGNTEAAADQHHVAAAGGVGGLDVGGHAQRPDEVGEGVALVVVIAHLAGRSTQGLHHDGDRAAVRVEVGDGERNALGAVVKAHHHELAGLRRGGHVGSLHLPQEGRGRQSLMANDAKHPLANVRAFSCVGYGPSALRREVRRRVSAQRAAGQPLAIGGLTHLA